MTIADQITAARLVPDVEPGSREWATRVTATKIAPILGLSPWQSRYDVWHTLAGNTTQQEPTFAMLRGTHLEAGVIDLWHALNPDWEVEETGTWQSLRREWLHATPDRLARDPYGQAWGLECKTTTSWAGWGPDGSLQIPPHYDAQTIAQSEVLDLPILVIVLGPGFTLRTYERRPERWVVDSTMDEVEAFLRTLPGGPDEQEPEPGLGDEETYRQVTPIYRGWRREFDDDDPDAANLAAARLALDDAEAQFEAARMVMLLRMEQAEAVRWRGETIISKTNTGAIRVASAETMKGIADD